MLEIQVQQEDEEVSYSILHTDTMFIIIVVNDP